MKPQLEMAVEDPAAAAEERARDHDDQVLLFERLVVLCRKVARELTTEYCSTELDDIWGDRGRPVSPAVLRAALNDSRGNYFRIEWAFWFARHSEEVADLLLEAGGRGKPKKTTEEELRDLKEVLRTEYPKQAGGLIRKAASR